MNNIGQRLLAALLMLSVLPQLSLASAADATADAIALLQAARPGGVGSVENQRAAAVLVQQGDAAAKCVRTNRFRLDSRKKNDLAESAGRLYCRRQQRTGGTASGL
jgi:hypothetical protein